MWGLLETWILYCKKKNWRIPLSLGVVAALCYMVSSFHEPETQPVNPFPVATTPAPGLPGETQMTPTPTETPSPQSQPASSPTEQDFQEEEQPDWTISNRETIKNYTVFNELLRDSLKDYGDQLSRQISYRISQNLAEGETSLEALKKTIAEELPEASASERKQVEEKVVQIVGQIGTSP